ncbi:MAG: 2-oxoglutarate dehydrogenase complex dihydrolipoyllysine-residue succinyltransferase [Acidobacteriota bacterium]|nr:2-oxoglutarate dehydrogenase complex dihydrolipoyllysine-residue succinyltransferase [Acidobacteriota bacterium]MDQ7087561.1 2-oxoglutarate dehydrogenase complex dihydrolipoyllysine-residue succinyltransferase [Acidobacteriota bacterium]
MSVELKIPSFGESITDVVLGAWLVQPGEYVAQDDPVVVIETDKVTAELPAPVGGVLKEILKQEGSSAQVGDVVGLMEAGAAPAAPEPAAPAPDTDDAPPQVPPEPAADAGPRVMPAAARALAAAGLEAGDVKPSGPGGRLLKEDVLRHAAGAGAGSSAAEGAPGRATEAVTMTPMRRRIAERLVSSQHEAALLTTFNEIDMSRVIELRAAHKQAFLERYGVKLGFMSFFVKAAIEALKVIPELNARIDGEQIVYHHYYDIGVAIGGGRGLVVPVLRNAERMSFAQVEQAIGDFAARAKSSRLKIEELQGGTFTISNGGVYGSLLSTPIVNPPQSGILGLHAIQDRPVAVDGQVVIRPMMYVALTYDHRIVDGREAVTFLKRIKECVENPSRILLEI